MRHLLMVLGVSWVVVLPALAADSFYLVGRSGEKVGPIEFKEGETVKVGEKEWMVEKGLTETAVTLERLESVKIPEVRFKETDIRTAVKCLAEGFEKSETHRLLGAATVSFIFDPSGVTITNMAAATNVPVDVDMQKRTVSFEARYISVAECLEIALRAAGMKRVVRGSTVWICNTNAVEGPLVGRMFRAPSRQDGCFGGTADTGKDMNAAMRQWLEQMGVHWPPGSFVVFLRREGLLQVVNTEENLATVEKVFQLLYPAHEQVDVEYRIMSFDAADIGAIGQTGKIDLVALNGLIRQGKAKLIAAPQIVTEAGSEATVKGVLEYIYPTEFSVLANGASRTESNSTQHVTMNAGSIVEPGGFETREAGAILQVLAEVDPDNSLIHVTMAPQYTSLHEWRDYGQEYVDPRGQSTRAVMEQPVFATVTCSTTVHLADGETILLGGGVSVGKTDRLVYGFLTVRKVGVDGKPIAGRKTLVEGESLP